jgi:protein MAK11
MKPILLTVMSVLDISVKSVDFLVTKRPTPHSPLPIIVTVSSDGTMNVYDASAIFTTSSVSEEIGPMASYDTLGSRLVCCCVAEVTKTNKQVQAVDRIKVETIKKEEPGSTAQTRFKDDEASGEDDGAAGDDAQPEEEEENEEEEQEEEIEDEVEEE